MKKITVRILIPLLVLLTVFSVYYVNRYAFRNDKSALGKVTNSLFNLNRVFVRSYSRDTRIVWSGKSHETGKRFSNTIFDRNGFCLSKLRNTYGPQAFEVFVGKKEVAAFILMKSCWDDTYDYTFVITKDTVILGTDPDELRIERINHP